MAYTHNLRNKMGGKKILQNVIQNKVNSCFTPPLQNYILTVDSAELTQELRQTMSNRCVNPVRNSNLRSFFQEKGPKMGEIIATPILWSLVHFAAEFFQLGIISKLGLSGNNCALFTQKLWVISKLWETLGSVHGGQPPQKPLDMVQFCILHQHVNEIKYISIVNTCFQKTIQYEHYLELSFMAPSWWYWS